MDSPSRSVPEPLFEAPCWIREPVLKPTLSTLAYPARVGVCEADHNGIIRTNEDTWSLWAGRVEPSEGLLCYGDLSLGADPLPPVVRQRSLRPGPTVEGRGKKPSTGSPQEDVGAKSFVLVPLPPHQEAGQPAQKPAGQVLEDPEHAQD